MDMHVLVLLMYDVLYYCTVVVVSKARHQKNRRGQTGRRPREDLGWMTDDEKGWLEMAELYFKLVASPMQRQKSHSLSTIHVKYHKLSNIKDSSYRSNRS
jgi:hypothetical protein